ncbi:hypothetical protein D9753_35020 [Streptomyces dangxiongensis]|uniref:Uncharacterized protein n=1 Tax=Streptomyces dangxiongensis TaxID=1442032 RepID=A0A3G2JLA0_9ACTN|nr:hypothetical protein D9753_35020 [Streptomyces dangxiongensis]
MSALSGVYIIGPDVTPEAEGCGGDERDPSTTTEMPRMNRSQATGPTEARPASPAAADGALPRGGSALWRRGT